MIRIDNNKKKWYNKMMIHRCTLCNKVNNPEIETEYGDFSEYMAFRPDPENPLFDICMECFEDIEDQFPDEEEDD
jgi:hypothetical protein